MKLNILNNLRKLTEEQLKAGSLGVGGGMKWNNTGTEFKDNKFSKDGKTFYVKAGWNKFNKDLFITVLDENGEEVSVASFKQDIDGKFYSEGTGTIDGSFTNKDFRGKGLMKSVYDFVDKNYGEVKPSKNLTNSGLEFWESNRKQSLKEASTPHSSTNRNPVVSKVQSDDSAVRRILLKIVAAKDKYSLLSDEQKEQLGYINEGDGLYSIRVRKNGDIFAMENDIDMKRFPGDFNVNETQNVAYGYVMARCGAQHPEYDKCIKGVVFSSPAAYATFKALVFMDKEILSFIKGYDFVDDEGERQSKMMGLSDIKALNKKRVLYKKRDTNLKTSGDDYASQLRTQLNDLTNKSITFVKNGMRREASLLRADIAGIKQEIKFVERLDNLLRDNPDQIPNEIKSAGRDDIYDKIPKLKNAVLQEALRPKGDIIENVIDAVWYLKDAVWRDFWLNRLSKEEMDSFKEEGFGTDFLMADGTDHFQEAGIINFYTKGLSEDTIKNTMEFIESVLDDNDIHMVEPREGKSNLFNSNVIRIPIII